MITLEGRLLNLDSVDVCGRKWAKDRKISFPDKLVVLDNFHYDRPPLGSAEIIKDECGLSCKVALPDEFRIQDEYYVGGYYHSVESHMEASTRVITSCKLVGMSLIPEDAVADKNLKIRRINSND